MSCNNVGPAACSHPLACSQRAVLRACHLLRLLDAAQTPLSRFRLLLEQARILQFCHGAGSDPGGAERPGGGRVGAPAAAAGRRGGGRGRAAAQGAPGGRARAADRQRARRAAAAARGRRARRQPAAGALHKPWTPAYAHTPHTLPLIPYACTQNPEAHILPSVVWHPCFPLNCMWHSGRKRAAKIRSALCARDLRCA